MQKNTAFDESLVHLLLENWLHHYQVYVRLLIRSVDEVWAVVRWDAANEWQMYAPIIFTALN